MHLLESSLLTLGEFVLFLKDAILCSPRLWRRRELFLRQCEYIGVSSLGVLTVAAIFMGAVMGYQLYVSFKLFNAQALLGGSVGVSLFRELAPVIGAMMVTGRAGAAMAAELASMRISEQIDALEVMAVNPIEFLVTPRVWAGTLMMPLLAVYFAVIGSLSAWVIATQVMDLESAIFWRQFAKTVDPLELVHCTVKGAFFGLIFTWIGCYCGFSARGGARAVGLATRTTVVAAFLTILLVDYILTSMLPFGFATLSMTK